MDITEQSSALSIASLGGGCFWCLEAVYESVHGVNEVVSGYMGGAMANPSYAEVCTGTSGHAEVVQLHYDPAVIGYSDLLDIFFTLHDPTTRDRQGNDCGSQYRSVIFYHDAEQEATAKQVIAHLQPVLSAKIVTEVVPALPFYRAEPEHQHYFARHPEQGYCVHVVKPKVTKIKQYFPQWQRNG